MREAKFGEELNLGGNPLLTRLTSKDQTIHLRLVGSGKYDAVHYLKTEGKMVVYECPRIMEEKECPICDEFFTLKRLAKEAKESGDKASTDDLERRAKDIKPAISFYYPIVDRDDKKAKVFKTTIGVKNIFDADFKAGVDVLDVDYKVTRTEKPGSYYAVVRLDTSQIKPLDSDEKQAVKDAKAINLDELLVKPTKISSKIFVQLNIANIPIDEIGDQ